MNKKWIIIIVFLLITSGILLYVFWGNISENQPSKYNVSRTSVNNIADEDNTIFESEENISNNINEEKSNSETKTKISSFSTPIVDDDENRINNIEITCSKISGTVVKPNEEFSFHSVVGQPNTDDGYKEAHAIVDGEIVNEIGGGNCQVSTTIYNAAKEVDGVEITERHEHGKDVGYIEMGKDATVAYDYYDLKFENNNDFDLELEAYIEDDRVCVDIYKIV